MQCEYVEELYSFSFKSVHLAQFRRQNFFMLDSSVHQYRIIFSIFLSNDSVLFESDDHETFLFLGFGSFRAKACYNHYSFSS